MMKSAVADMDQQTFRKVAKNSENREHLFYERVENFKRLL